MSEFYGKNPDWMMLFAFGFLFGCFLIAGANIIIQYYIKEPVSSQLPVQSKQDCILDKKDYSCWNDDYNCSNLKWCDTLVLSKPESRPDKNISYGSYFFVTVYGSNKRPYANCISIASNSALNKFDYLCMVGSD